MGFFQDWASQKMKSAQKGSTARKQRRDQAITNQTQGYDDDGASKLDSNGRPTVPRGSRGRKAKGHLGNPRSFR